jgi:small ligand-binding sensory domain FIST
MAVGESIAAVLGQLAGQQPDLVLLFVSPHHAAVYDFAPRLVSAAFGKTAVVLGCSAGGVIGGGVEVEREPAVTVTAAVLPDVELEVFGCDQSDLPDVDAPREAWQRALGVGAGVQTHWLLFPDPFSIDTNSLISGLDRAFPGGTRIGGLASGGGGAGQNALFLGASTRRQGIVGVAMRGNLQVDTIVAQGCRPIGEPMFITSCKGNILRELDGRPAFEKLSHLVEELSPQDRELARHSLFLGIVMRRDLQEYGRGDFLVRNLVGADPDSGALAIGAMLENGAVVQFHLRDAETSADDLEQMLERHVKEGHTAPSGALLFSCLGRGEQLYGEANHDSEMFRRRIGAVPLGGFFCNGEIGPVQGQTFLHGYTSAFALFSELPKKA